VVTCGEAHGGGALVRAHGKGIIYEGGHVRGINGEVVCDEGVDGEEAHCEGAQGEGACGQHGG
jgi:hypothetical protein